MDSGSSSAGTSKKQSDLTEVFHVGTGFCCLYVMIWLWAQIIIKRERARAKKHPLWDYIQKCWKSSTMYYALKFHSAK